MCAALRPLQACPLSGGKFRFPSRAIPCPKSLPLQACLGLLFPFLPFFCPFVLPPAWRGWLSLIQVRRCSGFAHSWVTLAQQGLSGVSLVSFLYPVLKLAKNRRTGASLDFLPRTSLPLPLKGEGLGIVYLVCQVFHPEKPGAFPQEKTDTSYPRASLGSCLWQPLLTNGSQGSNKGCLGLHWCRFPALSVDRPQITVQA